MAAGPEGFASERKQGASYAAPFVRRMDEKRKVIALCYPGNDFNYVVVSHLLQLQAYLLGAGYEVAAVPSYMPPRA